MAHPEDQLNSRIVRTGELEKVMQWGITDDDYTTPQGRTMFLALRGYFLSAATRRSVMGEQLVRDRFPSFQFCDDPHVTTEALCTEVRRHRISRELELALNHGNDLLQRDPMEALSYVLAKAQTLRQMDGQTNDKRMSDAMDEMIQRYELAEQGIGTASVLWPWDVVNEHTGGIQSDDFIVYYGRPKSKKSFVIAAKAASFYAQGKKTLVYTKEMPDWQLFRRIAACYLRLPYGDVRLGHLNAHDKHKLYEFREEVKEEAAITGGAHDLIIISGKDVPGADNIGWVEGKIQKYKPDVVIIDGLYLLSPQGKVKSDEERVRGISRQARQMVLDTGVPLIATMQATRSAAKHSSANLDEIAYSDALAQDATAAIRVINNKTTPTVSLIFGGSREFELHGLEIWAIPCTDFRFKQELTEAAVLKAKEGDKSEGEGDKLAAKPRKARAGEDANKAAEEQRAVVDRALRSIG